MTGAVAAAFKLSGETNMPEIDAKRMAVIPPPPPGPKDAATIRRGQDLYHKYCFQCHGSMAISAGVVTDLRYSAKSVHDNFKRIVLQGMLENVGMARFNDVLDPEDAEAIHAYIIHRANQDRAAQLEAANQ